MRILVERIQRDCLSSRELDNKSGPEMECVNFNSKNCNLPMDLQGLIVTFQMELPKADIDFLQSKSILETDQQVLLTGKVACLDGMLYVRPPIFNLIEKLLLHGTI